MRDSGPDRQVSDLKRQPWPRDGFVAVAGAESPERWVFLSVEMIEGWHSPNEVPLLRTHGDQRWLSNPEARALIDELEDLLGTASTTKDEDALRKAITIVDYELARGTGVLVVPPGALTAGYTFRTPWQQFRAWWGKRRT